jgi:hypothetical protein
VEASVCEAGTLAEYQAVLAAEKGVYTNNEHWRCISKLKRPKSVTRARSFKVSFHQLMEPV